MPEGFGAAVEAAFAVIAHMHARMSFHEDGSDLAVIRRAEAGQSLDLDRETVTVLRVANTLFEASGGLFDVTVGRQLVRSGFLPRGTIGPLRQYDGTAADIVIEGDTRVRLNRRVLVDLGGIAKGYAVDRAVETLTAHGVPCGLINAGGDLRAFGSEDWQIGLRDADDLVRSQMTVRDCAVASSANLGHRRSLRGAAQTPHIGRKRQPVLTDDRISVVAEACVIADAMTKIAMVDPDLADTLLAPFKGHVIRALWPVETI